MAMNNLWQDLLSAAPLSIVVLAALVVLAVDALAKQKELICWYLSLGGLLLAFVSAASAVGESGTAFSGEVEGDMASADQPRRQPVPLGQLRGDGGRGD